MLLASFYAILGKFYTLLHNTDLDLSYFDLSYVFPGHIDSVERGLTVCTMYNMYLELWTWIENIFLFIIIKGGSIFRS